MEKARSCLTDTLFRYFNQGDKIWRIFAYWAILFFEQFFDYYKSSQKNLYEFYYGKSYESLLAKNGLGYILGNFITNPSGHPEFFFL
jgi:hypothetical protein